MNTTDQIITMLEAALYQARIEKDAARDLVMDDPSEKDVLLKASAKYNQTAELLRQAQNIAKG